MKILYKRVRRMYCIPCGYPAQYHYYVSVPRYRFQISLYKRKLKINEVVYAVLAANGNIYIDTYKDDIGSPIDKE